MAPQAPFLHLASHWDGTFSTEDLGGIGCSTEGKGEVNPINCWKAPCLVAAGISLPLPGRILLLKGVIL